MMTVPDARNVIQIALATFLATTGGKNLNADQIETLFIAANIAGLDSTRIKEKTLELLDIQIEASE